MNIWQPWCRWEGPVPPHTSTNKPMLNSKQITDLCKSSQLVIRYLPLNYPQEDFLKMIQEQGEVVKWEQELQVTKGSRNFFCPATKRGGGGVRP